MRLLYILTCSLFAAGPGLGWWTWPDEQGVVKEDFSPGWVSFLQPDLPENLVSSALVIEALESRWYGVPVLAIYFHMAFGFGVSSAILLFDRLFHRRHSIAIVPFVTLAAPGITMVWDPAVRLLEKFSGGGSAARPVAAGAIMVSSVLFPCFIFGDGLKKRKKGEAKDCTLFAICLCNQVFFSTTCFLSNVHNPQLKIVVFAISAMSVSLFARGCGVFFFP